MAWDEDGAWEATPAIFFWSFFFFAAGFDITPSACKGQYAVSEQRNDTEYTAVRVSHATVRRNVHTP